MEGFLDGVPVLASVTFTDGEVPLLNGKPTTYGLLAEVQNGGVVRYFVPWTSIKYLRQNIPTGPTAPDPTPVPTTPSQPAPDGAAKAR